MNLMPHAPQENRIPLYIPHRQADYILNKLEFTLKHRNLTGEALGLRLMGPTNAGKSTAVKEFARRYPRIKTESGYQHPVVYVHLVERAKLRDIYIGILRALGDPAYQSGTETQLRYRAREMLIRTQVQFLIFDEPHHLTEARSDGARAGLTQLSKSLIDEGLCVVFAGVRSVNDLAQGSNEMARRFRPELWIGPYRVNTESDISTMRLFCDELGRRLPLLKPIEFGSDNYWFSRLLAVSNGLVGVIVQIVSQAVTIARLRDETQLTMKHMALAWGNFSKSSEEHLQHLKTKSTVKLLNVFELDDEKVIKVIGEIGHQS